MSVGGAWYPAQRERLVAEIDRDVARTGAELPGPPRALIAPHAALMYSGPVAAHAYACVRGASYRTVVLVGPSHFVPFRGASIWRRGAWESPFGSLEVDEPLADAIVEGAAGVFVERADAHAREHSLEMQLPFIAHLIPGARIVPIVMGHQTRETALALGEAIARAIDRPPAPGDAAAAPMPDDVLLVASSDLSHYEHARTAARMDAVVVHHVEAFDANGLMTTLEQEPRHACGGGPIVSVLHAARQLGATEARVLHYADSGDVSGDKSSVVGYLAAAIW
jgi:AmmeMemoRadiSam system protein B